MLEAEGHTQEGGTVYLNTYDLSIKNLTSERAGVTQILDKKRCLKEQIYTELLYVSCI